MSNIKRERFVSTLTSSYKQDEYILFLKELLVNILIVAPNKDIAPFHTFAVAVAKYNHIGNYIGKDNKKVALFSVCLKNDKNLENARSMQRNFIKSLLENSDCSGALVSFYTEEEPEKWRLSFVRMDYEFTSGKINKRLTPAKRYSYLVGKGEPCHTAQERLFPIFSDDNNNPGLDELEEAFSVEAVTKEFFDKYRDKYLDLKESLDGNPQFVAEAESRGFSSEQFAKKLMGQIVFLYFIQKKGWLGVNAFPYSLTERQYKDAFYRPGQKPKELMPKVYRATQDGNYVRDREALLSLSDMDETELSKLVKGDSWGEGPKDFMRQIFSGCKESGKSFFDDYLEPLFYTGLNKKRDNDFFAPLHRKIPFLNGGLFEELDGYDWEHNDFSIPNDIFSNVETKGRDADGILDVFDRYNFTMAEDEPMEREVAIDPEMLGKVFENLLDVSDRKSKGAFYTPREIVHYMCQETLIQYLTDKTGINDEDIRKFILLSDYFRDEDVKKTKFVKGEEGGKGHYEFDYEKEMEIPESILSYKNQVNRLKEIDDYLANIKVVDLAVGSGAFPLGMLNEIVKARDVITTYMTIDMSRRERLQSHVDRNLYNLKRSTIKNCIFACDIEASAVDITKLRLWLSLVIDNQIMKEENLELGYSVKPRELPNLECNIICGNSLVESFQGIKLFTENEALNNLSEYRQGNLLDQSLSILINELIDLQDKLYDEKNHSQKAALNEQIQEIYNKIVLEQISINSEMIDAYYQAIQMPSRPFVLWQLYFPKVFRDNGGFDVVIGNPPYVQLQKTIDEETGEKLGDAYEKLQFETYAKTGDLYCLFYEKGYNLLRKHGVLTFITSNKWMRAGYGEKLRAFFSQKTNPIRLIDFGSQKIFESATVDVNVLTFTKSHNTHSTLACTVKEDCTSNLSVYIEQNSSASDFSNSESWVILSPLEDSIRTKMKAQGIPLSEWDLAINYGIKTGFNDAFIISAEKKDELIAADPKSAEIIRPILRGRDIKRYEYSFANLWLINVHNGVKNLGVPPIDVNDYPAVKRHLDEYYEKLSKRADKGDTPYNLRNCVYMNDFYEQKIVWGNLCLSAQFAFAEEGYFINAPSPMIVPGNKYILAVLNSKLGDWYIRQLGVTRNGGYFEYKPMFVQQLPVPQLTVEKQKKFVELVDKILLSKQKYEDTSILEQSIDEMVYELYGLTNEEIEYIKGVE